MNDLTGFGKLIEIDLTGFVRSVINSKNEVNANGHFKILEDETCQVWVLAKLTGIHFDAAFYWKKGLINLYDRNRAQSQPVSVFQKR